MKRPKAIALASIPPMLSAYQGIKGNFILIIYKQLFSYRKKYFVRPEELSQKLPSSRSDLRPRSHGADIRQSRLNRGLIGKRLVDNRPAVDQRAHEVRMVHAPGFLGHLKDGIAQGGSVPA